MMKKLITSSLLLCSMMFFVAGSAFAIKPGETVNPNGFPSGEHFNLNIISKKDNFNCPCDYEPTKEVWDEDLQDYITKYNNVIFVPQDGGTNRIFMQSGTSKKRNNNTYPELTVTDPCTEAFPDRSGAQCVEQTPDGATLYLPKREAGYSVYARALGKPTDGIFEVTPGLNYVEDGNGNVLLFLGVVYPDGFVMPDGTFLRTSGKDKKGGGKSTALEITQMFEFNGTICYFDLLDVPEGYYPDLTTETELCCDEVPLLDENDQPVLDENDVPVMVYENCSEKIVDVDCTNTQVTAYCVDYETSPMWVFNVAEFVEYFWNVDSNGVHLLQVRFYPN